MDRFPDNDAVSRLSRVRARQFEGRPRRTVMADELLGVGGLPPSNTMRLWVSIRHDHA